MRQVIITGTEILRPETISTLCIAVTQVVYDWFHHRYRSIDQRMSFFSIQFHPPGNGEIDMVGVRIKIFVSPGDDGPETKELITRCVITRQESELSFDFTPATLCGQVTS